MFAGVCVGAEAMTYAAAKAAILFGLSAARTPGAMIL
jgi:hypothetical protein